MRRNRYFNLSRLILLVIFVNSYSYSDKLQAQSQINYGNNILDAVVCNSTDTLLFEGNKNDVVIIHIVEMSDFGGVCNGLACFCFDQQIQLIDSSNNILAINSSPTSYNVQSRYRTKIGPETLPHSGFYKITIRDKQNNGRGEYLIFLQRIDAPESSDIIYSNKEILRNLNRGEVDTYEFQSSLYDRVIIDMTKDLVGDIIPEIELYNPQGYACAITGSGHVEHIMDIPGFYKLLAFSKVDEEGTYRLNLKTELVANNPPIANADSTVTFVNKQLAIDVLENDYDPDSNNLIITSVSQGNHGSTITNGTNVLYSPNDGFIGIDEFDYDVSDLRDTSNAVVKVSVVAPNGIIYKEELLHGFELMDNYPNPYNLITNIGFKLPRQTKISISIYNIVGQNLITIIDGYYAKGKHEIKYDGSNLDNGIYLYSMEFEGFRIIKRMTVSR